MVRNFKTIERQQRYQIEYIYNMAEKWYLNHAQKNNNKEQVGEYTTGSGRSPML